MTTTRTTTTTTTTTTAFASKSIPPPPPISIPVYSLAVSEPTTTSSSSSTLSSSKKTSMNIMTYCTPVSVAQPKLWILSLYKNTMTRDYFYKVGILQLLNKTQCHLVPILGKRSGYEQDYDKEEECRKIGFTWMDFFGSDHNSGIVDLPLEDDDEEEKNLFNSIKVLPKCQSYIQVRVLNTMEAGDHDVVLCQVLGVGKWDDELECVVQIGDDEIQDAKDETTVLYTGYLRKEGII